MTQRLTVSKWAARHGMSKQAGYQAVKRCGITIDDGTVDVEAADFLYAKRTRARVNPKRRPSAEDLPPVGGDATEVSYDEARRRRESAEARLAELKLAEMAGKLVDRAEVERASFTASRILRDQLAAASPRLAAAVMGLADVIAIERTIAAEHRAVLETFCKMLRVETQA